MKAASGTFYVSPATVSAGFGTWSNTQNPGDVQGVAADWLVVTLDGTSYVINTSKVATLSALKAAGYNALEEYNYKDASGNYYADENAALASVNASSVKDVYVLPNSTTTVSKEVAWDAAVEAACQIAADMTQLEVGTSFDTEYTYWVAIDTKDDDTTALLDLAGAPAPPETDGKSLLPAAAAPLDPDRAVRKWLHGEHTLDGDSCHFIVTDLSFLFGTIKIGKEHTCKSS